MKHRIVIKSFNIVYAALLICYLVLLYYEKKFLFLTNSLVIICAISIVAKILYIYRIRKIIFRLNIYERQKKYLLLLYCLASYISPIYCIIQGPYLILSNYVFLITLAIIIILLLIGIFMEKNLFNSSSLEKLENAI